MSEKLLGFLLMCFLVPMAILGYLIICFVALFGRAGRGRAGVRALDHFVNATVFNGYAWESISSHAWRMRDKKRWARFIVKVTNYLQQDHCRRAAKRESQIVEIVEKRKLWQQTIWKD